MTAILTSVGIFLISYTFILPILNLLRNYNAARKTGLKTIISPITPYTWWWQLSILLFSSSLHRFSWFRAIDWTCAWQDGNTLHLQKGPSFILVSPGLNVLCTSDPRTIEHVLKKWRAFVKPDNVNEILGTFGQNVDTSNGDDWVRHRKLVAPCFSERASGIVWREAVGHSNAMISSWLAKEGQERDTVVKDMGSIALNVISSVAFENHAVGQVTPGHTLSLRDSLVTVMSTAISPALEGIMPYIRKSGLQVLLPAKVKGLLVAMAEFRGYMDETIARERGREIDKSEGKMNLISTLIKASEYEVGEGSVKKTRLSDVELRGNVFIFTVGGLESTAITLSYALALLAVHEEFQEWVVEEIREVFGTSDEEQDYTSIFPRLKRVMAVMYETLRIYGPSPPLPRSALNTTIPYTLPMTPNNTTSPSSPSTPQTEVTLPGPTQIMLNSWACQISPTYFSDPKTWNPKRWIDTHGNLIHPTSESGLLVWGAGPRICPGMKFSQVEFTGVLANVLRRARVGLSVGKEGEGRMRVEEVERVMGVLGDSCAEPLLLHVREPEKLVLRIFPR